MVHLEDFIGTPKRTPFFDVKTYKIGNFKI